jgi:hypothetical protein
MNPQNQNVPIGGLGGARPHGQFSPGKPQEQYNMGIPGGRYAGGFNPNKTAPNFLNRSAPKTSMGMGHHPRGVSPGQNPDFSRSLLQNRQPIGALGGHAQSGLSPTYDANRPYTGHAAQKNMMHGGPLGRARLGNSQPLSDIQRRLNFNQNSQR